MTKLRLAFSIWIGYVQITFAWYYVPAALVLGMMVSYAATFDWEGCFFVENWRLEFVAISV